MNAMTPQKSHKPAAAMEVPWQQKANCLGVSDPEMFFDPPRYGQALLVCSGCPVIVECRELGRRQTDGVWGGRVQHRKRGLSVAPYVSQRVGHGTEAGLKRHVRAGEAPCSACVEGGVRARMRRSS